MTAKVEQLQSEWRQMVELAQKGEDVVLTSKGEIVARLVGVQSGKKASDRKTWLASLAELRHATASGKPGPSSDAILNDLRAERGK